MLSVRSGNQNARVFRQINEIEGRTDRGIRQGFFRLGNDLVRTLRRQVLERNKRGRTYIRKDRAGRRRRHIASAAGQTPANRTGNYRKNAGYQLRGSQQLEFGIREGADYGLFLEEGTKNMAPRPGLGNAVKANQRNARTDFDNSLDRELNAQ